MLRGSSLSLYCVYVFLLGIYYLRYFLNCPTPTVMIKTLLRVYVALGVFAIGWFWACIVVTRIIVVSALGGRKGLSKLFRRKEHLRRPEVASAGYHHDYVRTRSGVRFHYVYAGEESKPLMLCLHGFPECWYSWKHVLKEFSSEYHVVAVDMRGYGDSDKPKSISKYHMDYLINDVKEMIPALGYKKAVLVGHDWGGIVAWETARTFPDVISKLIVMNAPSLDASLSYLARHPKQFLKSWYIFLNQWPYISEWIFSMDDYKPLTNPFRGRGPLAIKNSKNFMDDEEIEVYKHSAAQHVHYGINYYRALNPLYQGMNLAKPSGLIQVPSLLIWGTEDAALETGLTTYMKNYVKDLKLVYVHGASHWVALDEPEQVLSAMKEFLS